MQATTHVPKILKKLAETKGTRVWDDAFRSYNDPRFVSFEGITGFKDFYLNCVQISFREELPNPAHHGIARQTISWQASLLRALGLCFQTQYISWKNKLTGLLLTSNLRLICISHFVSAQMRLDSFQNKNYLEPDQIAIIYFLR
ncbi:MAG: hypothetical protein IRF16MM_00305 [Candidatus Midichloria mitochondrii]